VIIRKSLGPARSGGGACGLLRRLLVEYLLQNDGALLLKLTLKSKHPSMAPKKWSSMAHVHMFRCRLHKIQTLSGGKWV
jgi:hypothetical protein